ncbi:MAG TPA: chorismate-binding protein [Bacteroidales bacterium]|nr:chorismate-binding protein [Bacteroidales bacterium]
MNSLNDPIGALISQRKEFVCYRLPGSPDPVMMINGHFREVSAKEVQCVSQGFIVAPFFISGSFPILLYSGGEKTSGWKTGLNQDFTALNILEGKTNIPRLPCINRNEYLEKASGLLLQIKKGRLKKVVLSRVICQPLPENFNPGSLFGALCSKYPNAFVYIFSYAGGLCWMGASPETLLEVDNNLGFTMSLAGTRPAGKIPCKDEKWTAKEVEEQEIVSTYIRDKLIESGLTEFAEEPIECCVAGPVVHLLKRFRFKLPEGLNPLELAFALHPTPAVCGLPQKEALKQINLTETHERSYYGGFLGPIIKQGNVRLFVNLRCMQFVHKFAHIFAGGGLLEGSDLEKEWDETCVKAETLISVIRNQSI